jgi:hypothetical protein
MEPRANLTRPRESSKFASQIRQIQFIRYRAIKRVTE